MLFLIIFGVNGSFFLHEFELQKFLTLGCYIKKFTLASAPQQLYNSCTFIRGEDHNRALFYLNKADWRGCTHNEHSDERSLQQSHQHVTPVVFEVRDARVCHVQRKRHQEELDRWSDQSRPLPLHSGLDVKLDTHKHTLVFYCLDGKCRGSFYRELNSCHWTNFSSLSRFFIPYPLSITLHSLMSFESSLR